MSKVHMSHEVSSVLENAGWVKVRLLGSRVQYMHPTIKTFIILPEDKQGVITERYLEEIFKISGLESKKETVWTSI